MTRKKVKLECRLKSWREVDDALRQIAECQRVHDTINNEMDAEIAAIRKRYEEMLLPVQEKIAHLETDVCQFTLENRHTMERKTKVLNFGTVGFRAREGQLKYYKGVKVQDVLDKLKELKLFDCIKSTEVPRRDVIKKKPQEILDQLGVYVDKEEEYFYETRREEILPTKGANA